MPAKTAQLSTFEEADQALRHLGAAQRELQQLELDAQTAIDRIKTKLAEQRVGADAAVKSLTRLLTKFIERHQADIEERGGKTVRLAFGRIGTRTEPPALKIDKGFTESDVIHWLREKFPTLADGVIVEKFRLDRDELKQWDEGELAEVGLHIEQAEAIVIEPAEDVVSKEVA